MTENSTTLPALSARPESDWHGAPVVLSVALVAVASLMLHASGRIGWCGCGGHALWVSDANSPHTSQHALDPYSFSHLLHGLIFYAALRLILPRLNVGWRFFLAVLIETGWELLENSPIVIERYRKATASLGYTGDSVVNSIFDILSCAAGFVLARWVGWKASLAILVAVELVMLAVIRDNLTLNVIMLVHPVQAIKTWQMGSAGT